MAFVVVDCGADTAGGGFHDHRGGAASDQMGCADVLNRNPASLTLLLSNGRRVDVPGMEQLHGTLTSHVPHRVKQLLNEGASHAQPRISRAKHPPADQSDEFISKDSTASLSAILFTGDAGPPPGWMRALSVSNTTVRFAAIL